MTGALRALLFLQSVNITLERWQRLRYIASWASDQNSAAKSAHIPVPHRSPR